MELRDRDRLRPPVAPGMSRDTYRAFALRGVMLNPPPWHLPRYHFNPQDFPDVELRRGSLATCNVTNEDPGYGLFVLSNVVKDQIISWYAKDIISMKEATELKARGNRHIRIVKVPGHCLNSQPRPGRDYDYYASRHELAGFANSSHHFNAYFVDVGDYVVLVAHRNLTAGTEVFANYNF